MRNRLIDKIFKTPLGKVFCGLESSDTNITYISNKKYKNGESETFELGAYSIELVEFKVRQPLYNGNTVMDSQGWIWRIEKKEDINTQLTLVCKLLDFSDNIEFDVATGQYLDAIEASDFDWKLHIGTEDTEAMNARAISNNEIPSRFKNEINFNQPVIKMVKNGFETEIPELKIGERLHIHFIAAYDKQSSDSISTWLAVDESKSNLEKWIGMV